jgi:ribonuclease HI
MAAVPTTFREPIWCRGGTELVTLLGDAFGKDNILVRSPHHLQVRRESKLHNLWIDAAHVVKYKLADQAGKAEVAKTQRQLLEAIQGHELAKTDLAEMRYALELSELIDSAKAAMPLSGLSQAVFVDAGMKGNRAQIGLVQVSFERDGEHVRAESHPITASNSTEAEEAAINFALQWAAPDEIIFCDNQVAVERATKTHGNRVRWLPRQQNKVADRVANLRGKNKKRRRKRKGKTKATSKTKSV